MSGRRISRWTGIKFRELVALVLQTEGFPEAEPRPTVRTISDEFAEDRPASDILNVPGWTIHTRADARLALSGALDAVERSAALDGTPGALLVEYRRDHPGASAYAVMSLSGWSRLARAAQDREPVS